MYVIGAHPTAEELPIGGQMLVRVSRKMSAPPGSRVTVCWRNRPGGTERTQWVVDQ